MDYIDEIYAAVQGLLTEDTLFPWVQNAFTPGSPCEKAYSHMQDAYARLCKRLGVADEDPDVEVVIDSLLEIQRELCREMFLCGRKYEYRK